MLLNLIYNFNLLYTSNTENLHNPSEKSNKSSFKTTFKHLMNKLIPIGKSNKEKINNEHIHTSQNIPLNIEQDIFKNIDKDTFKDVNNHTCENVIEKVREIQEYSSELIELSTMSSEIIIKKHFKLKDTHIEIIINIIIFIICSIFILKYFIHNRFKNKLIQKQYNNNEI